MVRAKTQLAHQLRLAVRELQDDVVEQLGRERLEGTGRSPAEDLALCQLQYPQPLQGQCGFLGSEVAEIGVAEVVAAEYPQSARLREPLLAFEDERVVNLTARLADAGYR